MRKKKRNNRGEIKTMSTYFKLECGYMNIVCVKRVRNEIKRQRSCILSWNEHFVCASLRNKIACTSEHALEE